MGTTALKRDGGIIARMSLRVQLRFATTQGFLRWREGTPKHGFDYDFDPGFIPNDAPKPPMVREVRSPWRLSGRRPPSLKEMKVLFRKR